MPVRIDESNTVEASRPVTLLRALRVLDAIAELDKANGVALQQVADHLGESKSSVHRWLRALQEYGLVDQNLDTERYRLGVKTLELSSKFLARLDLRREAAPILHDLTARTGETVHLGIYDRGEVVYVEKLDGLGSVAMRSQVGARMRSHCTALGKALLAYLPAAEVQAVVSRGLELRTPNTIVDPIAFLQHLEEVRLRGYAIDNEENEVDIICVAAPVFDHSGHPVAAISVSSLAIRMTRERITQKALEVRAASEALSSRLGYRAFIVPEAQTFKSRPSL